MNWKYFIPHVWEEEETIWEDIYLKQFDKPAEKTLYLSINGRLMLANPSADDEFEKRRKEILVHLDTHNYLISEPEMYVKRDRFNIDELLYYTNIFLQSKGYIDNNLIEGTYEEFIQEIEALYGDRMVE
ncbi:hypothetical protein [Cesiribacter sp. SM1]|uniref:hypothetical protein n=1 Tax=Cesiribacter sp. SM1 TaxID=2861196 RepID=UPI001CD6B7DE|nr:hypothetical protein [Cesiribacter sp. SM1]